MESTLGLLILEGGVGSSETETEVSETKESGSNDEGVILDIGCHNGSPPEVLNVSRLDEAICSGSAVDCLRGGF